MLWLATNSSKLSPEIKEIVANKNNKLFFSVASIWEVAIKQRLKKNDFHFDASVLRRGLLDNSYEELSINGLHALAIEHLQDHHKDPFDRILIAQANVEGFSLLTSDNQIAAYDGLIHLV